MSAAHAHQRRSGNGNPGSNDESASHTPSSSSISQHSMSKDWPPASAWRDMNARSAPFTIPSGRGETSPTSTFLPTAAAAASPPTAGSSDTIASSSRGDPSFQRFASPPSVGGADGRSPSPPTKRGPFPFGSETRERWSSIGQAQHQHYLEQKRPAGGKGAFSNDPLFGYGDIWGNSAAGGVSANSNVPAVQQRPSVDVEAGRAPRGVGSISVDTMQNRFDGMNVGRPTEQFVEGRGPLNGSHASRPSMQDHHLAGSFPPLGPSPGGGSLSPRSMMHFHQQQLHAAQQMAAQQALAGPPGPQPGTAGGALDVPRNGEEITTVFIVGFPDDMSEREFANMFLFAKGFEASTLKIPAGVSGPAMSLRSGEQPGNGPGGPYNAVNMGGGAAGPYDSAQGGNGGSSSAGTGSWDEQTTPFGAANGPQSAGVGAPPGKIKQIIGFAKFRTRGEALEARDALNGRKIDAERGCVLKTEMAKKNLHTKQRPVLSGSTGMDGQAPSQPQQIQQHGTPAHVSQQQQQQQGSLPPPPPPFSGVQPPAGGGFAPPSGMPMPGPPPHMAQQQGMPVGQPSHSLGLVPGGVQVGDHGPQTNAYGSYQPHGQQGQPAQQQGQQQHFDPFYGGHASGPAAATTPSGQSGNEVISPASDASHYGRSASRSFSSVAGGHEAGGGAEKWTGRGPLDYFDHAGNGVRQHAQHPQQQQQAVSFAGAAQNAGGTARGANWNSVSSPPGLTAGGARPISFGEVHAQQSPMQFAQAASRGAAAAAPPPSATGNNREDFRRGESIVEAHPMQHASVHTVIDAPHIIAPVALPGGGVETVAGHDNNVASPPSLRPHSRISNRATSPPIHAGVGGVARFGSMRIDSPMQNQRPFSPHAFMRSPPPPPANDPNFRATSPGSPPISSPTSRSFSIDANPPGNTLFVGNLPASITAPPASTQLEDLLYKAFSAKNGFRQMSFRVKNSGPMCFIEFDDVGCAGRALGELNGDTLEGLVKGGLRLSFSKHPLFKGTTSAASSQHGGAQTPPVMVNGGGGAPASGMHEQKVARVTSRLAGSPMIDLNDVSTLEEKSYQRGWNEGNEHGKLHGLYEGRQIGTEKGYDLWLELGHMEGLARTWLQRLSATGTGRGASRKAQKQLQQLQALLDAIAGMPMDNDESVDLGSEMERLRARYRSICISLGVKEAADGGMEQGREEVVIKGRRVDTSRLTF